MHEDLVEEGRHRQAQRVDPDAPLTCSVFVVVCVVVCVVCCVYGFMRGFFVCSFLCGFMCCCVIFCCLVIVWVNRSGC